MRAILLTDAERDMLLAATSAAAAEIQKFTKVMTDVLATPAGQRLVTLGRYAEQHPEWRPS
jgi:hypothetical protein